MPGVSVRQMNAVIPMHSKTNNGGRCMLTSGPHVRNTQASDSNFGGTRSAVRAQCKRNVTIWVCGHTRDPYFVTLGALLLFDSGF